MVCFSVSVRVLFNDGWCVFLFLLEFCSMMDVFKFLFSVSVRVLFNNGWCVFCLC